jgi:hypothetical protein
MERNPSVRDGFLNPRLLLAFTLCASAIFLSVLSLGAGPTGAKERRQSSAPSAPLATGPGWSLITAPNQTYQSISSVTCVSSSDCWGVGNWFSFVTNISQTLTQHWNGSTWSIIPSPSASTTFSNRGNLQGVACASSAQCFAVGEYQTSSGTQQPLIERWDGASWTIVPANTSTTLNNYLTKVTCTSASDCWAVGSINTGTVYQTLIVHWNGSAWAVVTSQNTDPTKSNGFTNITCVSAADCWAVGNANNGTTEQTLVERWDGTSWSIVPSQNNGAEQNFFLSVTCVSSSDCWAVGAYQTLSIYRTLTEHWNGTAWSIVALPNTPVSGDHNILYDVKCASTSDCNVIGYYVGSSGFSQTLAQHWNGSAWSIVSSPNASPDDYIYSIACSSTSECWAFGYFNTSSVSNVLMLHWNGIAWSLFASTNLGTTNTAQNNSFNSVTCLSARECWAVGNFNPGGADQTLIARWNGISWSIVSSPNTSISENNYLNGIACNSSTDCWASGIFQNSSNIFQTLIEHWNGNAWSIVPSPNTNVGQQNALTGIACISASDCSAVGHYVNAGGFFQTLVLRWNGSTWAIVPSLNSSATQDNFFNAVSCVASECWAVGAYHPSAVDQPLVEKWDGTSWSIFSAPSTSSSQNNNLNGVSCPAAGQCIAVGAFFNGTVKRTLVEQWSGFSSSIVPSPNTDATHDNSFNGVTCTSPTQCWAVGSFTNASSKQQPLIEQWNGSVWAIATSNNNTTQSNFLGSVTCPTAANCWAVGTRNTGTVQQALINQYALTTPSLATVFSRLTHGTAGKFDVDLPQTGPRGVECRSGGGGGAYTMVFTFPNNLTSVSGVTPAASVTSSGMGPNPTGVTSGNSLTVTLNGVLDVENNTGNVPGTIGVLLGDTSNDTFVNSTDIAQTKSKSGQFLDLTNFRADVTVDGNLNSTDITLVKSKSGTALP